MRKARLRAFRLLNDPLGDIRALTSSLLLVFFCFANLSVSWLCCVVILLFARNWPAFSLGIRFARSDFTRLIFDLLALKISAVL